MQKLLRILMIGFTFVALNVGTVAAQTGMQPMSASSASPIGGATSPTDSAMEKDEALLNNFNNALADVENLKAENDRLNAEVETAKTEVSNLTAEKENLQGRHASSANRCRDVANGTWKAAMDHLRDVKEIVGSAVYFDETHGPGILECYKLRQHLETDVHVEDRVSRYIMSMCVAIDIIKGKVNKW